MNASMPVSISQYLDLLRQELRGADPAMIQDALYDAEEHLRGELADHPEWSEQEMLSRVVGSYGAPSEVAEIYRDKEADLNNALRIQPLSPIAGARWRARGDAQEGPRAPAAAVHSPSLLRDFFGVAADPRTYASLFYLLLTFATGIFYFTWVTVGVAMSAGLSILIIGLPFIVLFFGTVRALSLVEGRLVEVMLGVRMPRRPRFHDASASLWRRIGTMFTDPRSWLTLFYMVLMLPLGLAYFSIMVVLLAFSGAMIFSPLIHLFAEGSGVVWQVGGEAWVAPASVLWLMSLLGILLLFSTLHLARGLGRLHGQLARHLLVEAAAS